MLGALCEVYVGFSRPLRCAQAQGVPSSIAVQSRAVTESSGPAACPRQDPALCQASRLRARTPRRRAVRVRAPDHTSTLRCTQF